MKAGGTYPTIVQGVSGKQPQHRRPGQTGEQVNFLSDPVHGLARRRGTRYAARRLVTLTDAIRAELREMDVFDFTQNNVDYALLIRRRASVSGSATFAFLYDKTNEAFLPIVYENSAWVDELIEGGASAQVAIGNYVYIAGNTTIPDATQVDLWNQPTNLQRMASWIRTGKYNTPYKLTLTRPDNTTLTVEYKTDPAAYPGTLDTSDIPFYLPGDTDPDPEYQKKVNDRVNEYNSAVNEWTVTAAENIRPENIAQELADLLIDEGVLATSFNGAVLVDDPDFVDIEVSDDGDNTTVYSVGREITDATRVTKYHFHGKIVRVRPSGAGADEAFYLQARLDNGETSGYGAVSWFEVEGVSAVINNMVAQLIIHNGSAYVARNGAGLESLAPTSGEHPDYVDRAAGDGLTAPLPWFIGKPITMLSVFQDRLVVGSTNYVNTSRSSDYLNFFRGSIVTIADSDPVEIFAHGSEGDTLRSAVLYNNSDLIIFGDAKQYGISGSTMLTPKSPIIKSVSANKDATDARPLASGNFIFYCQYGTEDGISLHQMRVLGVGTEQTQVNTSELSDELGSWFGGVPLQVVGITAPNIIMVRTGTSDQGFYLYRYEDSKDNGQRTLEAWHEFRYHTALGVVFGVSSHKKQGIVFSARDGAVYADVLSFNAELDTHGYLDSRVPYADRALIQTDDEWAAAVVSAESGDYFLLGTWMAGVDEILDQFPELVPYLEYGVPSPGVVVPTNPFPRDQNGNAVLDGRMSLGLVRADVADTAGMRADVVTPNGIHKSTDFEGRILGQSNNLLDTQPLYTGQLNVPVGREVRECVYQLRTKDWLPCRITGLSWIGQTFNNVRRVS